MHDNTQVLSFNSYPEIDPHALRQVLGSFATGVTVATTINNGEPLGFTANSFTSVSLEPALVLICIANTSLCYGAFKNADTFCINILGADQQDVSSIFAKRGADKFESVSWQPGTTGVPVLSGVAAHLECSKYRWVDAGDHAILIGQVIDFDAHQNTPLCFHKGQYRTLENILVQSAKKGVRS